MLNVEVIAAVLAVGDFELSLLLYFWIVAVDVVIVFVAVYEAAVILIYFVVTVIFIIFVVDIFFVKREIYCNIARRLTPLQKEIRFTTKKPI